MMPLSIGLNALPDFVAEEREQALAAGCLRPFDLKSFETFRVARVSKEVVHVCP